MSDDTQTVTVRLGGENVVLKPSAAAAAAISRQFGGISGGFERLGQCDIDAIAFVVAVGSGKFDAKALKDAGAKVYGAGIVSLVGPTSRFLGLLLNGGRLADDVSDDAPDGGTQASGGDNGSGSAEKAPDADAKASAGDEDGKTDPDSESESRDAD